MDLSRIPHTSVLGKLLRFPLRLLPQAAVVPVLQGPIRGDRWIVGASNHSCWLGFYEQHKVRQFQRTVLPGQVVYDIGANAGYYSLVASRLVGTGGRVFAFEPLAENVAYLRRHVALNRAENITVAELAVSDTDGTATFHVGQSRVLGHLSAAGSLKVETVRLDTFLAEADALPPNVMKIDVEGAEAAVLRGAERIMRRSRPILFLATHGAQVHAECCRLLQNWEYRLVALTGTDIETTDELVAFPR